MHAGVLRALVDTFGFSHLCYGINGSPLFLLTAFLSSLSLVDNVCIMVGLTCLVSCVQLEIRGTLQAPKASTSPRRMIFGPEYWPRTMPKEVPYRMLGIGINGSIHPWLCPSSRSPPAYDFNHVLTHSQCPDRRQWCSWSRTGYGHPEVHKA